MTTPAREGSPEDFDTRTGYVTLIGPPNAGKSTLMNALVGEQLSIVTPKAQTTWQRVTGILTTDRAQMIFLDTPGLLDARDLLQRSMLASAQAALQEADVLLLVVDASKGLKPLESGPIPSALADRPRVPLLVAFNKMDLVEREKDPELAAWVSQQLGGEPFFICALKNAGVEGLRARLEEALPAGPHLYPADEIASEPVRFFVAEMIRETVFQEYHQEIPYSVFCQIEEFREAEDPVYIQAHVFVERKSQKGILIGKGGSSIRNLSTLSREKIEEFLGRRVYLDLWIKILPDWRRKRADLRRLGFPVPDEGPST
ncbi:MAG: GTPase Era [Gemmatimonadetes bacterium]|nr:GTPase Era [Gemmatimonadota bacterium]